MSRRTKPKDPFRDVRRRVVNEQLAERITSTFESMWKALLAKHVPKIEGDGTPADKSAARMTATRTREIAMEYATSNRAEKRAKFGTRSVNHGIRGHMAVPKGRRRRRRSA